MMNRKYVPLIFSLVVAVVVGIAPPKSVLNRVITDGKLGVTIEPPSVGGSQIKQYIGTTNSFINHWSLEQNYEDILKRTGYTGISSTNQPTINGNKEGMKFTTSLRTRISVPWSAALNPTTYTVTLWVKAATSNSAHASPLTSRTESPTAGYIIYNVNGKWQFWTGSGYNSPHFWNVCYGGKVKTNTWQHLAISYQPNIKTMTIHVDGISATKVVKYFKPNLKKFLD